MTRVAVVGGGYAGAAFAVHLSRQAVTPLDIIVVEPRHHVGGGLAYSTADPNHRLNAPDVIHFLYPDDEEHFRRWLENTGRLAADPGAWYGDGRLYPRRGDFGAYVAAEFAAHRASNASSSSLEHRRDRVQSIERRRRGVQLELAGGDTLVADRCVIALGHEQAPFNVPGDVGDRLISDPLASGALAAVAREAAVLVVGTGLTAADAVTSLVGQGHTGSITCLSRRGLRPEDQNPAAAGRTIWERMAVQPPPFVQRHGVPQSIVELTRIVREDARERMARGEPWHGAIDDVRDAAGELWRGLTVSDRRRFLRHLKPYYDAHRFRIPPQTRDIVRRAEERGQLRFESGRILDAEAVADTVAVTTRRRGEARARVHIYDAVVSCVGLSDAVERSRNSLVRSCLQQGLARPSDMARGLDSDDQGRLVDSNGTPDSAVYVIGGMTLDRFGETPAAIFILRQILDVLPGFIASMDRV
jgi:uncharacterized NAD(P)/FAD-binding protein YdhS